MLFKRFAKAQYHMDVAYNWSLRIPNKVSTSYFTTHLWFEGQHWLRAILVWRRNAKGADERRPSKHGIIQRPRVIRPPSQSLAWLYPFRVSHGFDAHEPSATIWPLSQLAAFSSLAIARCGACGVTRAIQRAITLATRFRFVTLPLRFLPSLRDLQLRYIHLSCKASCRDSRRASLQYRCLPHLRRWR